MTPTSVARARRRERLARGESINITHGGAYTRKEHGCSCDPCVEADRERRRLLRGNKPRRVFTEDEIASAMHVYTTEGLAPAAAQAQVSSKTIRKWALAAGVECYKPPKKHGTRSTWWRGCKCDVCREGMRAENKRRKAERIERFRAGLLNPVHGSTSTYCNYDCRCEPCRAAWSVLMAKRAANRKARQSSERSEEAA